MLRSTNCINQPKPNLKLYCFELFKAIFFSFFLFLKVFSALGTETSKPSSAASCIAGIAGAELPYNLWPDLMKKLCENTEVIEQNSDALKEATLEAIGYICQDIDAQFLTSYAPHILKSIVNRMGNDEQK